MRTLLWTTAGLLGAVLVTNVPAGAHHASAPFYDPEKQVEAVGTVTEFVFRNPHSFVYLDAPTANGDVVGWEVEMGTAVMMTRRGWTSDTIRAGDEIRVVGQPSRAPGTYGICCAELTRPDGSPIRP